MEKVKFPKGFLWGASSSAFQTEGGNIWNDWYRFYVKNKFFDNGCGGKVCDHYSRFREDFDLAKQIGLDSIRISIEWSRIEKSEGIFDEAEIKHYIEVLKYLKDNNFTTFVTLHHFTNPLWFTEKGGWTKKANNYFFLRFVERVVPELDQYVDYWLTVNEPTVYAVFSFVAFVFPPRIFAPLRALRVIDSMAAAHNGAYDIIKGHNDNKSVGVVHNGAVFVARNFFTILFSRLLNYLRNFFFLDRVYSKCDFIGVNYYMPISAFVKRKLPRNDLGWPIYPRGIYDLLKLLHKRYEKPMFITENGIADAKDRKRGKFIEDHLRWISKAIDEGVDCRGYLYWSLTDNLELAEGLEPRFGLIEVDYPTQKRRIRESVKVLQDYIR